MLLVVVKPRVRGINIDFFCRRRLIVDKRLAGYVRELDEVGE